MLLVTDVIERVKKIYEMRGDDEIAHLEQDNLYRDVLEHIATYSEDLESRELAANALKVREIEFARWYA